VITLRHLTRRKETSLVGSIKDGPHQVLAAWIQLLPGFCVAGLEHARRQLASMAIKTTIPRLLFRVGFHGRRKIANQNMPGKEVAASVAPIDILQHLR
jgi:hypothetical protein